MKQQNKNITPIDWEFIIETIKNEKCILFIGPELFKDENGLSVEDQLAVYLDTGNNPGIRSYYKDEGLFLFESGAKKTTSYYKIKSFYNQHFPRAEAIFNILAKIPFHCIVSLSPDKKCYEAFKAGGMRARFGFYWKGQHTNNNMAKPSVKNPLLYNMLGSVDRQESMVLTHDDLFDYLESMFRENSIPEKLKLNVKEADNLIFLGLDFKKWYMQLLLRILHLHDDKYEFMRYAANQKLSEELRTFCVQQFKMEFIPTQIDEFVKELAIRCEKAGLKREKVAVQSPLLEQCKAWLAQDRLDDVLNTLKEFLKDQGDTARELAEDLLLLTNRHRRLNRRINLGVMDSRDIDSESNKIRFSLINLLNEAEKLE